MLSKRLEEATAEDVQGLIDNAVREGRSLDYKLALPGNSDADKREFLADVTSFANAGGGDIIWGVDERRDSAGQPTGIPDKIVGIPGTNLDAEVRRLEAVIRDGVDPRIPGVRFKPLDDATPDPILLLRISRSWASPHLVKFKNLSRFYSRNSAGKYQLDVTEIRAAFLASEGLATRVARFRDERIGRVIAGETPVGACSAAILMHVFPSAALNPAFSIDLAETARTRPYLPPLGGSGFNTRFNFDGLLMFGGSQPADSSGYLQLFRSSVIETVDASPFVMDKDGVLPSQAYEKDLIQALAQAVKFYSDIAVEPPFFVLIALVGFKGCRLAINLQRVWRDEGVTADRDVLILPDVVVDDVREQPATVLRPAFDAVWQAFGHSQSANYDQSGEWVGQG